MYSSVEHLEDNRVKLTVKLDEAEFEPEIEAAFKRLAREVRLPGFRPGRVPRRLLEARLGHSAGRLEALRYSLPDYYSRAVTEHEIDVINAPEFEVVEGSESGDVCFDAVVEVRPTVTVSGYDTLSISIPSPAVGSEQTRAAIDSFRQQFAELSSVSRAARDGDHLRIDISCQHAGEVVEGLTTSDYDYRLGSGVVVAEIDENLRGASVGDILEFTADHPDPDEDSLLHFRVLVKEVLQPVLPELTDDFVKDNSEFDTADEMEAKLHANLTHTAVMQAQQARREALSDALAGLVNIEVPEVLIKSEMSDRLDRMVKGLSQRGYDLEDYLGIIGQDSEQLEAELRVSAFRDVKLDLALRAVAAAEGLEADDEAVDEALSVIVQVVAANTDGAEPDSEQVTDEANKMREHFASTGQLSELRWDITKQNTFNWVAERVELVDPDGNPVDPQLLEVEDADTELTDADPELLDADLLDDDLLDSEFLGADFLDEVQLDLDSLDEDQLDEELLDSEILDTDEGSGHAPSEDDPPS